MSWPAVSSAPHAANNCCCVWLLTEEFNIIRPTTFLRLSGSSATCLGWSGKRHLKRGSVIDCGAILRWQFHTETLT